MRTIPILCVILLMVGACGADDPTPGDGAVSETGDEPTTDDPTAAEPTTAGPSTGAEESGSTSTSGTASDETGTGSSSGEPGDTDEAATGTTEGVSEALSFADDIYPIFTASTCLGGGCHGAAPGAAGLDLEDVATAYAELVDVPSTTAGFAIDRVEPGDSTNSYLPMFAQSALVPAGALTPADVVLIREWIDDGAEP